MFNDFWGAVVGAIISSVISLIVSLWVSSRTIKMTAHSESGWRKELLKLCSKRIIEDDDLLKLRALVNPYRKTTSEVDIDNCIINFCDKYYGKIDPVNVARLSRYYRMFARTLLKRDWIFQQHNLWFRKKRQNKKLNQQLKSYIEGIDI